MFKRFRIFLGPERTQALFLLLAITGLGNLVFNALEGDWTTDAQTVLVLVFLAGTAFIIGGRLDSFERGRWVAILVPVFIALFIGFVVLPQFIGLILGLSLGWILAGVFIFRAHGPMEYREAVKYLRKSEYADAIETMNSLIKAESDRANHYRFRAEIYRLWGKLDRARKDYEKMIKLEPDSAVAYNGLAEVSLQAGKYDKAHEAAEKALELAPDEWVAAYNLGMIEDRLGESQTAIFHLNHALNQKVPDVRHRVLIQFYLARAYSRLGDEVNAQNAVEAIKKNTAGLDEWQIILESPQATTLRAVLAEDIDTAGELANDKVDVMALAGTG